MGLGLKANLDRTGCCRYLLFMNFEGPLWQPSAQHVDRATITEFRKDVEKRFGLSLGGYAGLHQWSLNHPAEFWGSVWALGSVRGERGARIVANPDSMRSAHWFPDASLNYAENLLRRRDEADAIVFWGEDRVQRRLSHSELYQQVASLAAALRADGVTRGDRVAGYMPNMPETVIAMLAAASIGAVWSSCSPDFGVQGVLDRFGQIEPVVLFVADGYWYGAKQIGVMDKVRDVVMALPSLRRVVVVPYAGNAPYELPRNGTMYGDYLAGCTTVDLAFEQLPFNHPLFVMYSSGTTGVPKCIVHGAGGTLLQHSKEHRLHTDVKVGDRLFYYTTCGWMMWNWLVSGLASGATLVLYDGSPFAKRGQILWDLADAADVTHFGTSAKYIDHLAKLGLEPMKTHKLKSLRSILSTGSPLAPESFDYVYQSIKQDLCLSSISGGTDILSCFALGHPALPVWRGELQCVGLGMAVDVFDEAGHPIRNGKGELVCTQPFPSMPVGFWNDPDGCKYQAAYFDRFPGVWHHGDYCELTEHEGVQGLIIHGRSDATLNPGGVRIGTAEIYRQVALIDEVLESVVIGQDWENDVRVVLFVKLRDGATLEKALVSRIKSQIRDNTTPRHVPAKIIAVPDIPRTKSNKIVELAVRNVVHGLPVQNLESLANPEALDHFRNCPELAI